MSSSPTNINLSDSTPNAKPDAINVEWQADNPVPDPSSPGNSVRNVSACYRVPQVGGVLVLTDVYEFGGPDSGFTFIVNSASPLTLTLPPVAPILAPGQGIWTIRIVNRGAGLVTVDPNGLQLDGSGSTVPLATNSGFDVSTDGTNYWTTGNFAPFPNFAEAEVPTGAINGSNTNFTLGHTPLGTPIVEEDGLLPTKGASSFGYTLTGTALVFTDPPQRSVHLWYRY